MAQAVQKQHMCVPDLEADVRMGLNPGITPTLVRIWVTPYFAYVINRRPQ